MTDVAAFDADQQFVTLGIDQEVFAAPVEAVVEILDMRPMFRIPDAPPYLAGLIDVRGRGVPVIDLRLRLGLPPAAVTDATRILVLETPVEGRTLSLGLIADRVFEVTALDDGRLEAAPDIGLKWRSDHIRGVGRRGDSFVVVFDLARLLSSDAPVLASAVAAAPQAVPEPA
ncbi:MAG TPA: chemotaxis protein CheW [Caulobacteraceae bacterium]|nr:chemotaxis protein CheW [Caulobacteraceae bacterium]